MDYLLCIPARETNTRENCEKIHNVLARMSDTYKLRIVPEPVKNKQFPCPPYYKKYRIYKPVKERDTNGEAYLEKEEEEMLLSSCKTEEEQELMKSCIYAYQRTPWLRPFLLSGVGDGVASAGPCDRYALV